MEGAISWEVRDSKREEMLSGPVALLGLSVWRSFSTPGIVMSMSLIVWLISGGVSVGRVSIEGGVNAVQNCWFSMLLFADGVEKVSPFFNNGGMPVEEVFRDLMYFHNLFLFSPDVALCMKLAFSLRLYLVVALRKVLYLYQSSVELDVFAFFQARFLRLERQRSSLSVCGAVGYWTGVWKGRGHPGLSSMVYFEQNY